MYYEVMTEISPGYFDFANVIANTAQDARETMERLAQPHGYKVRSVERMSNEQAKQIILDQAPIVYADHYTTMTDEKALKALDSLTPEAYKDFMEIITELANRNSASADTESTTAPGTDRAEQSSQAQHDTKARRSTAPRTEAEATTRIHYIDLNQVTGPTDGIYHRAIKKYVLSDEGPAYSMLDWAILIAYGVGIQEGQRRERQRRKKNATR